MTTAGAADGVAGGVTSGSSFGFVSFAVAVGAVDVDAGGGAGLGVGGVVVDFFTVLPVNETFVVLFGMSGTFSVVLVGVCFFVETLLVDTVDLTDA